MTPADRQSRKELELLLRAHRSIFEARQVDLHPQAITPQMVREEAERLRGVGVAQERQR